MPMSSDLSPETRLLICEKYGFSPRKFSELQAKAGKDDFKYGSLSNKLEKREQQLRIQQSVFRRTSENIDKNLPWLPFNPFKIFCLKHYNDLVETFAKIYDLEIE
uniref:Uncharacterized protein n=1 Tax=Panagrolaimus sp. PS1159 TaxID=55785 RepID=A0AC35GGQ6_9BILA